MNVYRAKSEFEMGNITSNLVKNPPQQQTTDLGIIQIAGETSINIWYVQPLDTL
jgi:hypothetical protein